MNEEADILRIANIHADRIKSSIRRTAHLVPFSNASAENLDGDDLAWVELMISRLGKLQDLMGAKVINIFLEHNGEPTEGLTVIDKLNKLEKFGIIENADVWREMRSIRNHISHEYPDHPEVTAKYLNRIYDLAPMLLDVLDKLKAKMKNY